MGLFKKAIIIKAPEDTPYLTQTPIKTIADASDYVPMFDVQENPYRITKANLLADLTGSGGTIPPVDSVVPLTFAFSGDDKGLFYYLGSSKRTTTWSNPHLSGIVEGSMSSAYEPSFNRPDFLFDRLPNYAIATSDAPNSWYKVDLKAAKVKPNYYSIRARDYPNNNPSNWKLQGSEDGSTWTDLDSQQNRNLQQNEWSSHSVSSSTYFRYFRLLQTGLSTNGDNYFCVGEMELYGFFL